MIDRLTRWLNRHRNRRFIKPGERDWAAGDLAQCVGAGGWSDMETNSRSPGPKRGDVLRVADVTAESDGVWLAFRGHGGWFAAGEFRKLRPSDGRFARMLRKALAPKLTDRRTKEPTQ
jgi:hypothetical protein